MRKVAKISSIFLLVCQNSIFCTLEDSYQLMAKAYETWSVRNKSTQNHRPTEEAEFVDWTGYREQEMEREMAEKEPIKIDLVPKNDKQTNSLPTQTHEPQNPEEPGPVTIQIKPIKKKVPNSPEKMPEDLDKKIAEINYLISGILGVPKEFCLKNIETAQEFFNSIQMTALFGLLHKDEIAYMLAQDREIFNYRQNLYANSYFYFNFNRRPKPAQQNHSQFTKDLSNYLDHAAKKKNEIPIENILAIMAFAQVNLYSEILNDFNSDRQHLMTTALYPCFLVLACATGGLLTWYELKKGHSAAPVNNSTNPTTFAPTFLPTTLDPTRAPTPRQTTAKPTTRNPTAHPTTNLLTNSPTSTTAIPTTFAPTTAPFDPVKETDFLPIFYSSSGNSFGGGNDQIYSYTCTLPLAAAAISILTKNAYLAPFLTKDAGKILTFLQNNVSLPIDSATLNSAILAQNAWENSVGNKKFGLNCFVGDDNLPVYGNISCRTFSPFLNVSSCSFNLPDGSYGIFNSQNSEILWNYSLFNAYGLSGNAPKNAIKFNGNCGTFSSCSSYLDISTIAKIFQNYNNRLQNFTLPDGQTYSPLDQMQNITNFFKTLKLPMNSANTNLLTSSTFATNWECPSAYLSCSSTDGYFRSSCLSFPNSTKIGSGTAITCVANLANFTNYTNPAPISASLDKFTNKLPIGQIHSMPLFYDVSGDSIGGNPDGIFDYICQLSLSANAIASLTTNAYSPPFSAQNAGKILSYLKNNVSWPVSHSTLISAILAQKTWSDSLQIPVLNLNCSISQTNLPIYGNFSCQTLGTSLELTDCTFAMPDRSAGKLDTLTLNWDNSLFNAYSLAGDTPKNLFTIPSSCGNMSCSYEIAMKKIATILNLYSQNDEILTIAGKDDNEIYLPTSQILKVQQFFYDPKNLPLSSAAMDELNSDFGANWKCQSGINVFCEFPDSYLTASCFESSKKSAILCTVQKPIQKYDYLPLSFNCSSGNTSTRTIIDISIESLNMVINSTCASNPSLCSPVLNKTKIQDFINTFISYLNALEYEPASLSKNLMNRLILPQNRWSEQNNKLATFSSYYGLNSAQKIDFYTIGCNSIDYNSGLFLTNCSVDFAKDSSVSCHFDDYYTNLTAKNLTFENN